MELALVGPKICDLSGEKVFEPRVSSNNNFLLLRWRCSVLANISTIKSNKPCEIVVTKVKDSVSEVRL